MNDIGPGDWVECVDAEPLKFGRQIYESNLVEGAVYCVRRIWPFGAVSLYEVDPPRDFSCFNPDRFRPIYRPKADLIDSLKAPRFDTEPVSDDGCIPA